jgi:hypothetical protein
MKSFGNSFSRRRLFRGAGASSTEQNPIHTYSKGGEYIVTLTVQGPAGKSRRAKVWDVVLKSCALPHIRECAGQIRLPDGALRDGEPKHREAVARGAGASVP